MLTVKMREIIIVNTQTVSVPPNSNMSNPQNNGATASQGTQQSAVAGGATVGSPSPSTAPFNYAGAPYSAGFGTGGSSSAIF
jgi:hypothetical protein